MTETTAELDTKQEAPSANGHDATWQTFDTDDALLAHIISKEPAEEVVEVAEWNAKILCKGLDGEGRWMVEAAAYNPKTKRTDYSKATHLIVLYGCYNPKTGNRVFSEAHKDMLKQPQHGGAVALLAITVLRLSGMLVADTDRAKKN